MKNVPYEKQASAQYIAFLLSLFVAIRRECESEREESVRVSEAWCVAQFRRIVINNAKMSFVVVGVVKPRPPASQSANTHTHRDFDFNMSKKY